MARTLRIGRFNQRRCSGLLVVACLFSFVIGFFVRGIYQLSFSSDVRRIVASGIGATEWAFREDVAVLEAAAKGGEADAGSSRRSRAHVSEVPATRMASEMGDQALKKILEEIAPDKEVLVAVSNHALISKDGRYGMLKLWVDGVKQSGVKNFLVICLDDQVAEVMLKLGVHYWRKDARRTADSHDSNHGISARKFQLIKEFLVLGYSVLLSDVDILTLKNPFDSLHRDHDIEGLSDGFDPPTAYGYDDVFDDYKMGWSRYAHTIRIFVLNSGLFYTQPNERTMKLMDRITDRLMHEQAWDQAVFNEEIFFPSHGDYNGSHIAVRIMDIYDFVNSKTLFRTMRYESHFDDHIPVMIHVNYHPDKFQRMQSIWKRYVDGDKHALDGYTIGSCREEDCKQ